MAIAASLVRRKPCEAFLTEALASASYPSTPDAIASFTTCSILLSMSNSAETSYRPPCDLSVLEKLYGRGEAIGILKSKIISSFERENEPAPT